VPHAAHGCVDIHCARTHLLEQRPQLILVHDARISEGQAAGASMSGGSGAPAFRVRDGFLNGSEWVQSRESATRSAVS
jgi:hypothetical protein